MPQVFTANRLTDGLVVYLTATGDWSEDIDEAFLCTNESETNEYQSRAEQAAVTHQVVEPYAIDVQPGPDGVQPVRCREVIRAFGPSIDFAAPASAGAG